jgi:hypothetical protein
MGKFKKTLTLFSMGKQRPKNLPEKITELPHFEIQQFKIIS